MRKLMSESLPARSLEFLDQVARLGAERHCAVYVVGGFVRDLWLGIENLDIDVVVEGEGIQFARALGAQLEAQATPHPRFGTTVLTLPDGRHLDVATARRETYRHPGALPDVEPGTIEEDLARRDFSINSLAVRLSIKEPWELIDLNNGVNDLKNKSIRILHDNSFVDDPTRIFRAVRFEQRLGFAIEENTEVKLRQALGDRHVDELSGHRVFNELTAILAETDYLKCLRRMAGLGILTAVEPSWKLQERDFQILEKLSHLRKERALEKVWAQADSLRILLLGLLWSLDDKGFNKVLERLDPPGKFRTDLQKDREQACQLLERFEGQPALEDLDLYHLMAGASPESVVWVVAVVPEGSIVDNVGRFFREVRPKGKVALTGDDLIQLGFRPGPRFQEIFEALLRARLDGRVHNRQEEEALVRKMFPDPGSIRN